MGFRAAIVILITILLMLRILKVSILSSQLCCTLSDCTNHNFYNSFIGGKIADDVSCSREKFFVGNVLLMIICTIHFQKSRMSET